MPSPEKETQSQEGLWYSQDAKFIYYKLHNFNTYTNVKKKEQKYDILIVNKDGSYFKHSAGDFLSRACRAIPASKTIPVFVYKRDQTLLDAISKRNSVFLLKDQLLFLSQIEYQPADDLEDTPRNLYLSLLDKYGELSCKDICLPLRINAQMKTLNDFYLEREIRYMLFLYEFFSKHQFDKPNNLV